MGVDKPAERGTPWFIPAPPRWPLDESRLIAELGSGSSADHLLTEIAARTAGPPPLDETDARTGGLRRLAVLAVQRLERWRGPTWRRRRETDDPDDG